MRRTSLLAACVLLTAVLSGCASTPSTDNSPQLAEDPAMESPAEADQNEPEAVPPAQEELVLAAKITNGETIYYNYDQDGTLLSSYSVYSSGNVHDYTAYEYANGLLIGKQEYDIAQFDVSNNTFKLGEKDLTVYEYDANGVLSSESYFSDEETLHTKITYDSDGNVLIDEVYNNDGSVAVIEEYSYDSQGNEVSFSTYIVGEGDEYLEPVLHNGLSVYLVSDRITSYEYDNAGRILKETQVVTAYNLIKNGRATPQSATYIYSHEYDERGILVKSEASGKNNTYTIYTYDEKGHLIDESTYYNSGTFIESMSYVYDEYDRLISELSDEGHGTTYIYDTLSNIIANQYATLAE